MIASPADHLALAHRLSRVRPVDLLFQDPVPFFPGDFDFLRNCPAGFDPCCGGRIDECTQRLTRICNDRQRALLVSIVPADIDADELHTRVLKC